MGYKISVNGEQVWESESEAMAVDKVSIHNSRGEVAVVGSSTNDSWLKIEVNERGIGLETYLDVNDAETLKARQEKYDAKPDKSREGYVEADPETGLPVEKVEETSVKTTKKAAATEELV
jgi:hypothetical protein